VGPRPVAESVLPPAADLGPSWAVAPAVASPTPSPFASAGAGVYCGGWPAALRAETPATRRQYLLNGGAGGRAGVTVWSLRSAGEAAAVVAEFRRLAGSCTRWTFHGSDGPLPVTNEVVPVPPAGDRAACQRMSLTENGYVGWFGSCEAATGAYVVTTESSLASAGPVGPVAATILTAAVRGLADAGYR
jgi:hypothetical protein